MKYIFLICFYLSVQSVLGYGSETPPATPTTEYTEQHQLEEGEHCCSCIWPGDSYVVKPREAELSLKSRIMKEYPCWLLPAVVVTASFVSLVALASVNTVGSCERNSMQILPPCIEDSTSQDCLDNLINRCGSDSLTRKERAQNIALYISSIAGGIVFIPVLWILLKHSAIQVLNASYLRSHRPHFLDMTSEHISKRYQVTFDVADLEEAFH